MHAPIFVGDQIKFGESTRDYVIGGDETLMPEVGLTKRQLEKAKEMQKNFLKTTTQKLTPIQYKVLCKQLWEHQKKK